MKKYYTPDITEFKQGFKFEYLKTKKGELLYSWVLVNEDLKDTPDIKPFFAEKDIWVEIEVTWDREPQKDFITIQYGDMTVHYKETTWDLQPPIALKDCLKNGRIRAKCTSNVR